jgi:phosphatidylglycerophosphate synthase
MTMEKVLWLLALLGILGAFDTLYYHEYRGQLPARLPGVRPELRLHAARDFIYVAVFGSLAWLAWQGPWAAVFALLLTCEIIITIADFIVEDRVRRPLGGLLPGERATHALMGIVYGMMLANLVPNLLQWWTRPAGLVLAPPDAPLLLRLGITAMALGILVSGLRDLYAVLGLPRASWPWRGNVAARASR